MFFLLEQKEPKIQGERPTNIFRAQGCPGNGVKTCTHAGSSLKKFTELFINAQPRTLSPKPAALLPTYAVT
jgi:hypothetical protein